MSNEMSVEERFRLWYISAGSVELPQAFIAGYNEREAEVKELEQKLDTLTTQLVSYEATIGFLKDALQEIADEDFRGNRSSGSVKAFNALKKIKGEMR